MVLSIFLLVTPTPGPGVVACFGLGQLFSEAIGGREGKKDSPATESLAWLFDAWVSTQLLWKLQKC